VNRRGDGGVSGVAGPALDANIFKDRGVVGETSRSAQSSLASGERTKVKLVELDTELSSSASATLSRRVDVGGRAAGASVFKLR